MGDVQDVLAEHGGIGGDVQDILAEHGGIGGDVLSTAITWEEQ